MEGNITKSSFLCGFKKEGNIAINPFSVYHKKSSKNMRKIIQELP